MKARQTRSGAPSAEVASSLTVGSEGWLRIWYRVLCDLQSSWACDAELVIIDRPLDDGRATLHGSFESTADGKSRIMCAREANPCSALATLVHEVAHFAANPRHRRCHGYSWRTALAEICTELTGFDPTPGSDRRRQEIARPAGGDWCSRAEALDWSVTTILTEDRPWLYWDERRARMEAWVGDRRHLVTDLG